MPDLSVRTATAADTPDLEALVDDALGVARSLRGGDQLLIAIGVPAGISTPALASALCGSALVGTTTLVAVHGPGLVGFAVVQATGEGCDLLGVHTSVPARRRGIGSALLEAARSFAEGTGQVLEALALPGDQGVKSLLEAAGYKARLLRMSAER